MQSNHPFFLLFLFQLLQYSTSQYSQCINTKGTETITTKCKCGDFVCKIGKICRAYQSNSNQTAFSCESASHADLFTLTSSNYCGSTVATFVPTKQDCEWSARHQFKFNKFTASDPEDRKFATMNIKPPGTVIKPPGCYYDRTNRELWYNKDKTSTTTCTSNQPCICKYKCSPGSYSPITDCGRSYGFRTDVHQPCYSCLQCPIYTFQDTMGASYCKECFDCPAGKYSNAKGQSNCTCLDCQPGKYNSKVGQSSCALCLPGTYHVLFGQTTSKACELCRAGFYSDINGATSCKICPIDTISKDPAATMPSKPTNDDDNNKNLLNANINDCTWCPLKSFNISSSTSTSSTSSNHTYQLQTFSASRDVNQLKDIRDRCAFLPADLCNATMRPYLLQNLTTSPGCLHHYQDQLCTRKLCENEKYYHSDSTSLLDRKYLDWKPDACNTFHQIQPWKNKTITSTLPWNTGKFTSNYTCKPCRGEHCYYGYCDQVGYRVETGCHDCIQGYYKYDFNLWNVCEPCNDDNYDGLIEDVFISIFSIYVLLALLYMSLRSEAISYSTLNNNKNMKRKYGVSYQIQSPIGVVLPMLHQIHITALIIVIVTPPKYPWIGSLTRFTVNVLTFDLSSFYTSIQCASNITVRDRFLMSLSTPLLTVVVFGLWWMFANVWIRLTRTKKDKMTLALVAIRRIILRSFAITFFVGVYQPVVKTALSIFDCDIKDWTWTALDGSACPFAPSAESTFNWQGLPSSPFPYPTNHNNDMYGVIGILTLIFYGLVPFVSISIYVLKHLSNHRTENILDVNKTPKVALDMFDWVLHPYRKNKNWWDIFIGVYKLLILSMLSATLMVAGSRFLIILFMVTLSIILHLWNRPYRSSAMTVIWVLFDMTHVLGLMASVITETDKGFEFDIDFGETIHTATSPSPSTSLMDDTSTTGERLLRSLAQGGGKVARQSADSNLFTNDIFDPMGCFNATTLESNCHNKLPNVVR